MYTDETARATAALWQSPGRHGIGMAEFASTGTITQALLDDIGLERANATCPNDEAILSRLDEYISAQTVTVWTVGYNTAGYLPDSEPAAYLDYADAVQALDDLLAELADVWFDGVECYCINGGESCDPCATDAHIRAFMADEVPHVHGRAVFGAPCEVAISIRPDHLPLPIEVFIGSTRATVAEYRQLASV